MKHCDTVVPEHTRCARCNTTQHYLTMTNEVRCGCEDRFICARCIISQRDNVIEMLEEKIRLLESSSPLENDEVTQ